MITSKILSLSLLLVSQIALARVQLTTTIEINYPSNQYNHTISNDVQLDSNESVIIYDGSDVRVQSEVISEQENTVLVRYTLYAKNDQGTYDLVASPELHALYGQAATVKFGQKDKQAAQEDSLKLTLIAKKL